MRLEFLDVVLSPLAPLHGFLGCFLHNHCSFQEERLVTQLFRGDDCRKNETITGTLVAVLTQRHAHVISGSHQGPEGRQEAGIQATPQVRVAGQCAQMAQPEGPVPRQRAR